MQYCVNTRKEPTTQRLPDRGGPERSTPRQPPPPGREGSTRLLQQWGDGCVDALSQQYRLLRGAVEGRAGQVTDTQGDAILAVFHRARDGLAASVAAPRSLAAHPWPAGGCARAYGASH
jgi:hypothetical protein